MWKAEEDFPRGGSKNQKSFNREGEDGQQKTKLTLRNKPNETAKLTKTRPAKRKLSDSTNPVKTSSFKRFKKEPEVELVDTPLHQDLSTDVCVLGCVRQTHQYNISLSLPGNVIATLPITEISAAYTHLLQSLVHSEDPDGAEDVKSADDIFKVGMLLPVTIKEISEDKQRNRKIIKLSAVPSSINGNIPLKTIEDGMLLYGSVSSVEDHGYRVDLGVKGLQAFLSTRDTETFIQLHQSGSPLSVGQPVWCVLKNNPGLKPGESRAVNVTIDPDTVQHAKVAPTTNLNSLAPGMSVTATIQSTTENGLHVNVFNFKGVVHGSQLPKASSHYKEGEEVHLRVLYISPRSKVIQLTALPKIVQFNGSPLQLFGDIKFGSIMDATVLHVSRKKGVYFKLQNNVKGFAAMKQLSDKENPDITKFEKGMVCSCRVMGFNFMEGVALVTLKQSVLKQKFLSVEEISVGDIVETVVKEVTTNGVLVKLSKSIFAFIPCLHLADVPIKHPEKKFKRGMKMKCRVLKVNYEKSKVFVTHKKSLIKSKYPILTDYSQLKPYMELEGYIIAVKETVVIVAFFNDVKGYVTLKDMSMEKVEDPSTLFYVGQMIRCRVVHYNIDEKRLKLSFNFGASKSSGADKITVGPVDGYHFGKIVEAKVLRLENNGFTVRLQSKKDVGFLPFYHLSDFHEVQELRKLAVKPGQQLDSVMYFSKKQKKTIVTLKESFLQAATENSLVEQFDELKGGALHPAILKNHQDYGMFLELAGGHTGLCPAKTLTYLQPSNLQELFLPGQTVMTRIAKIDMEKRRFLGSVRLDECYEGGVETSLSLLKSYLSAREKTMNLLFAEHDGLSAYEGLSVGDLVEVTVSSALKKGILGDLASGAKALATKINLGGIEPQVGSKYGAIVLFVDLLTPCVELTLDRKLIKAISSRKENSKTQLKMGQILKADVLLVKPEFMLMSLRGHGTGRLVHVPVKQHINDVEVNKPYEPGTFTEVVIKDVCYNHLLAVLKSQDPEVMERERNKKINLKNLPTHGLQPGMVVDAQIKAVHPLQLNIVVNQFHGRVHISEVADNVEEGECPTGRFRQHQTVKVKVIGLRDLKSQSYLPITHPKSNRTLLECTMKESKMDDKTKELLVPKLSVKYGDKILAYVLSVSSNKVWFQISLTQQGYVDMFHLSTDVNILNNISSHFQTGKAYHVTVLESSSDDKVELSMIGEKMNISVGKTVTAQITSIKPSCGLHVKLPAGQLGVINTQPSVLHYVGQYVRCHVTEVESSDRCVLMLVDQSECTVVKMRKRKHNPSLSDTEDVAAEKKIIKMKKVLRMEKRKKKSTDVEEQGDSGVDVARESSDSDMDDSKNVTNAKKAAEIPRLSLKGFSWEGELSVKFDDNKTDYEDDDGDEGVKVDASKIKKKRKRDEEKIIQEYERSQLEGSAGPQSAGDFEKLVLQSPNSSLVWLRYMAFHIELNEIEKARAVAERALNTISFREEQEKKNVWLAYLNMETKYGEASDVKKLLERAVTYNDDLDINLKMCDIYVANGKTEDAELLYSVMSRKYKKEKSVWKLYGQFLFKSGRAQAARNLLHRCTAVLDKKDHVEVISRFANLEFTDGDKERGRTIFENLIASYPGRTDLWSVYVDMVAKAGDIEGARQLLERAVKQKLTTKKLSFLVQKYIRFEETHGTEDQVEHAKEMAITLLNM